MAKTRKFVFGYTQNNLNKSYWAIQDEQLASSSLELYEGYLYLLFDDG